MLMYLDASQKGGKLIFGGIAGGNTAFGVVSDLGLDPYKIFLLDQDPDPIAIFLKNTYINNVNEHAHVLPKVEASRPLCIIAGRNLYFLLVEVFFIPV
jgi:hypothetical protein